MATIDELNFKLIVDDSDFTAQVKKDMEAAEKLNISLTQYLNLKNTYNNAIARESNAKSKAQVGLLKEAEAQQRVNAQIQKNIDLQARRNTITDAKANVEAQRAAYWEEKRAKLSESTTNQYKRQSAIMSQLTSYAATYFSIYGAERLVSNMTRISAEFEKQRVSLRAILKDANGADALFEQIKGLAVQSPFQFKELVTYAKQLSAYSVPLEELYDTTKMLADVSAGLGVGMDRLVLAYGQIRSASFLRGQEVRQLTEAGIPILTELAKQFEEVEGRAVSAGEVFDKISARLVPFEMVQKVFKDMTSEGGKFFNMQEVQAETLAGKLSNLQDAYEIMFAEIGESGFNDFMSGVVDGLRKMIDNYQQIGKAIGVFVVSLGAARATILAYNTALAVVNGTQTVFSKGFQSILSFASKNPYMLIATGVATLATILYTAGTAQSDFTKQMNNVNDVTNRYKASLESEKQKLDYLFQSLRRAKEGTEEYNLAKKNILSTYSQYLDAIDRENIRVGNLKDAYDKLTVSITNAQREKFYQEGLTSIQEEYTKEIEEVSKVLESKLNKIVGEDLQQEISDYVMGRINKSQLSSKAVETIRDLFTNGGFVETPEGKTLIKDASNDIEELRKQAEEAASSMTYATDQLAKRTGRTFGEIKEQAEEVLTNTARVVMETLSSVGINDKSEAGSLWYTAETNYADYLEDLKKAYDDVKKSIANVGTTQRENLPIYEKKLKAIEAIADALGVSVLGESKTSKAEAKAEKAEKTAQQKAIEAQIKSLQDLKEAYDKLSQYADQNNVQAFLEQLYPHIDQSVIERLYFDTQLAELAEKLREYDEDAANAVLNSLGNKALSELVNKLKSANEWKDFMESFIPTSETEGEGMEFDLSKIVKDYKDRLKQIEDAKRKARERFKITAVAGGVDPKQLANDYGLISEDFVRQENNALNKATNDVAKSAEKWAKWWLETEKGFDLENFSDKSINELLKLKESIKEFASSDLPDEIKKHLDELGVPLDEFIGKFKSGLESWERKAEEATKDKIIRGLIKDVKYVGELADSVKALGEAADNSDLAWFGDVLGNLSELISNTLDGFRSGGKEGAIIAAVTTVAGFIVNELAEVERLKRAIISAQAEAMKFNSSLRLSDGTETIFGDNIVKSVKNAVDELKVLTEATKRDYEMSKDALVSWSSGFLGLSSHVQFLRTAMEGLGYTVTDEFGNLNEQGLQALIDTYGVSSKFVEDAIAHVQMYKEALEQLESAIEDAFGNLSNDIADQMINGYLEVGDATRDLADYMGETFSNLAQDIAREMVSSFILDNILSKYEEEVKGLYTMMAGNASPENIAAQFSRIAKSVTQDAEMAADFTNTLMGALEQAGVNFREGGKSMSSSISNITESQADLLASYINAIRADVSYNKVNVEGIAGELRQLVTMLYVAPTLNDYMMQIQANTYDSAESNREILNRIDSMLTTETGQSALRVSM